MAKGIVEADALSSTNAVVNPSKMASFPTPAIMINVLNYQCTFVLCNVRLFASSTCICAV